MKNARMKKIGLTFGLVGLALGLSGIKAYAADTAAPTSKDVRFTKTLVSPASNLAEIPDMKFDFTFTGVGFYPYSGNGVADQANGSVTVPDLASQEIKFTEQDMKAANDKDGMNTVTKQSTDVIGGVTFPKAGVYQYTVKEADDTNTFAPDPNKKEEVTYDGNTYTLRVWVTMDKDGNNTPSGTVDKVEKVVVTDKNANKVDPTPVTPTPDTPVDPDHPVVPTPEPNKTFNFKNIYTVTASDKPFNGNDPKTAPFWISKEVKGQMADNTLDFDYTLDIAANELTAGKDYELNIKRTNDDVDKVKVTPGTPATFKLKHGEIAYFEKIPAGAMVNVKEADTADYDEANEATFNGETPVTGTLEAAGALGTKGDNSVAYTNTQNGGNITPTGILLNNFPYIALILAGFAGLAFYIVKKRHQDA
ncbi:DUF7601 domain-containing protein [Enterococcus durans]|uniref:DUF7601 domain-containing protein n=1 Tax=Enterococcus durans TaxID=53345 RepID=UPI00115AA601|nr:FctA domain-containing protein [Enterococcus durans]